MTATGFVEYSAENLHDRRLLNLKEDFVYEVQKEGKKTL